MDDPDFTGKHVMVVEDEPGILVGVTLVLELEGIRVTPIADGRQALGLLVEDAPDLIITDYMMPYMTGIEFAEKVRVCDGMAHVPILLISGVLPAEADLRGVVDQFLPKPITSAVLLDALARHLR